MTTDRAEALAAAEALPDEEIVRRVCRGETALFELLMRRHNTRVYRAVRAVLGDEAEAEDVMQQAYLAAYAGLSGFAGAARFTTWLVKIAVHEAFARLRRRGRLVPLDGVAERDMKRLASDSRDPEEQAGARELAALLEAAIDRLPEGYRAVFVLREVEGMSTAEAAECLSLSEDALKQRLHRAKEMLREELYRRVGGATAEVFTFHASRCDRVVAGVLAAIGEG
jgi:RNA polymerase sigma-70 factor, ECF subfamily